MTSWTVTKRARAALVAVAILVCCPSVHADERAQAEVLFQQGKAAMARGDHEKACDLFERSLKMESTTGTLLNLALCHQEVGKVATSWAEFVAVEQRSRAANPPQEDRAQFAHEHAAALQPRLSHIRIVLPPEARVDGLVVSVDGVKADEALWDDGVPVDPGTRTVSATAPGKRPWSGPARVDDEKVTTTVTIPVLTDLPKAAPPPPPKAGVDVATLEAVANARARRTAGYIVGGIGVAGAVATGVFSGLAISSQNDEKSACSPTTPCYKNTDQSPNDALRKAQDAKTRAETWANVANVSAGVAVVGIGVGAYLILTAGSATTPKKTAAPRGVIFAPFFAKEGSGLAATGAF
jgi:hypothetical protein